MEQFNFATFKEATLFAKDIAAKNGCIAKVVRNNDEWVVVTHYTKKNPTRTVAKIDVQLVKRIARNTKYIVIFFIIYILPIFMGPLYVLWIGRNAVLLCFLLPVIVAATVAKRGFYKMHQHMRALWFYSTILGFVIHLLIK